MKRALIGLFVLFYALIVVAQDSLNVTRVWHQDELDYAVALSGELVCIGSGNPELKILDVSDPALPVELGNYDGGCWASDLIIRDDRCYLVTDFTSSRFKVIDVSDPAAPVEMGNIALPGLYPEGVDVLGDYAYITDFQRLVILNISDPSAPYPVGGYGIGGSGVAARGDYVYMASGEAGLEVINVGHLESIIEATRFPLPGAAYDVVLAGDYAYVAVSDQGLHIIDISDLVNLTEVGYINLPGYAVSVAVSGNYAFIGALDSGLRVIDVSDPSSPVETGFYTDLSDINLSSCVAASGTFAFVGDFERFGIYDCSAALSTPSRPTVTPLQLALYPAYPNPFNSATMLRFDLPRELRARLVVYDVLGRELSILRDGMLGAGSHQMWINAGEWTSGNYFVRLDAGKASQVQKIVLMK